MVCVIHNAGPGNIPECNIPERYTQRRPYDTSGAIALPPSKKKKQKTKKNKTKKQAKSFLEN